MKAFITATGTAIGKTTVACGILRVLHHQGSPTWALKPVVSGFTAATMMDSDPAALLAAQGRAVTLGAIEQIAPWRFAAPLAPHRAAAAEGRTIDFAAVETFCRAQLQRPGCMLIEGAGGVMVPFDDRSTMLDLMAALALPVILVAGSYLGTLSHTLTALHALNSASLKVLVVINASVEDDPDIGEVGTTIADFTSAPVIPLSRLPPGLDEACFAPIVQALATLQDATSPQSRS